MLDLSVLTRRYDADSIAVVELIGLRPVVLESFFFGSRIFVFLFDVHDCKRSEPARKPDVTEIARTYSAIATKTGPRPEGDVSNFTEWRHADVSQQKKPAEAVSQVLVGQLGPIADPERATVQVVGEGATEESDATEPFDVENDVTLRQRVTCARAGRELRPCDLVSTDTKNDIFASHLAEST